jgi:hypothetical protein
MNIIKKTRNDIKAYVKSLNTPDNIVYQENELIILSCFAKVQEILEENESEALTIPVVISRLKERLEVNAGRLAESILKQGKQPKDDKDCHKAFLMLAHLAEIEDYLNGL